MTLEKIISGGQTGADIGGLRAAKKCNVPTGGWMPKYWLDDVGAKPEYATLYGMKEHPAMGFPPRTASNVRDSDATMIFNVGQQQSRGTMCAVNACIKFGKPVTTIGVSRLDDGSLAVTNSFFSPKAVANWIRQDGIRTLNVAGNRESKAPGIAAFVESFMGQVIEELRK